MKKNRFFYLLMATLVAIGSLSLTACGDDDDDEDDGNKTSKRDYTFLFNGETYYYGKTYPIYGTYIHCKYDLHMDYYEKDYDYCYFSISAQDVPYRSPQEYVDEDGNLLESDENYRIDAHFQFPKFDPKTMKKGQELEVYQMVSTHRTGSDDPKYLFDFTNYLTMKTHKGDQKQYTWRGPAVGKIKFVSYTDHPNEIDKLITLEFDNVTLEEYQGTDYSSFPYKAKTVTINGMISFSSSPAS